MTEDEAKNKYCPLMPLNKEIANTCIASNCMMWIGQDLYRYEDGLYSTLRQRGINGKLEHHGRCGLVHLMENE